MKLSRASLTLTFLLAASSVWACFPGMYPSVHFNTREPDFGAAPRPLSIYAWGQVEERPVGVQYESNGREDYWINLDKKQQQSAKDFAAGESAALSGKWKQAIALLESAVKNNPDLDPWARDRIEVFRATKKPNLKLLSNYLKLRKAFEKHFVAFPDFWEDTKSNTDELGKLIAETEAMANDAQSGPIQPHAAFLLGALHYGMGNYPQAIAQFASTAKQFPLSPRAQASLYMQASTLLRSPSKADPDKGWDFPLPHDGNAKKALAVLTDLEKRFPNTRFKFQIKGWRARASLVLGDIDKAILGYLEQWPMANSEAEKTRVISSLRHTMERLTMNPARKLREALAQRIDLIPAYLDYRLFYTSPSSEDFAEIHTFGKAAIAKGEGKEIGGKILARMGEVAYLQGNDADAVAFCKQAINNKGGADLANYVLGSAAMRQKDWLVAKANYKAVLGYSSYLRPAARENLAYCLEQLEDYTGALEQYLKLGYYADIAYLLDVRMPLEPLAKAADDPRFAAYKNKLTFALGMRLLRKRLYDKASGLFAKLPEAAIVSLGSLKEPRTWAWGDVGDEMYDPRTTCDEMAKIQAKLEAATTDDARAEAQYDLASYMYERRNLLFYNGDLWMGGRNLSLGFFWDDRRATEHDRLEVAQHHFEHEVCFQAYTMLKNVVEKYPNAPVAAKCAYRAACASRRLADFNPWWRDDERSKHHWDEAIRLMKLIPEKYSTYEYADMAAKFAKVFEEERGASLYVWNRGRPATW